MLVPFVANMSWVGALSANLKGMASLSATIYVNSGSATIKEIVDGVWNAQTADYVEVGSMWEALPWGGGGGWGATAAQIWSYATRTLTESAWLTTEQAEQLTRIDERVDTPVSEIAVWWNPYIEWVNWLKKWIQKIVDKVEEKWEEVKTKIEEEIKTIVIPEQKEPIVNVTTEKIDTEWFMKAIKEIKPEVNITTEKVEVDLSPVLNAIWNIPQPVIPEQKETDLSPIIQSISDVKEAIDKQIEKLDVIEDYVEEEKIKELKEKESDKEEERMKEEEENLKKPIPTQFTAILK